MQWHVPCFLSHMRTLIAFVILYFFQLHAFSQNIPDSSVIRTDSLSGDVPIVDSLSMNAKIADSSSKDVKIYKLRPGADIPVTAIGTGWSLYAFTKIYSKERSSEEDILSLDVNDIPKFDRHGASVYHPDADKVGDLIFYSAMPLPILLMFDKKVRKDAFKIAFLYLESMAVTGFIYTGSVYLADRYRPYAYNPEAPMSERTRGGAKNSFFAGHVALVGTSTFFIAKVLNDYHPDSKIKWLPFTLAGLATATTGCLRYFGGQHFLSDILIGTTLGTLTGILIPHIHKNKTAADRFNFTAGYWGATPQVGFTYKLMK
jgi:membrane-associated phospholipid phosphatase